MSSSSVCVGVYMCVHMCIHTHVCIMYICMSVCICPLCTHVYIYVCTHADSGSPGLRVQRPSLAWCLLLLFASGVTSQGPVFLLILGLGVSKPCRQFILEPEPLEGRPCCET